jgi:hypothetical protein
MTIAHFRIAAGGTRSERLFERRIAGTDERPRDFFPGSKLG